MNLLRPILHHARTRHEAPALVEGERTITYGALAEAMQRTAGHFAALGVRPGDAIGLCLKDGAEHVVALLAAGWLGALIVPLDWRARPAEKSRVAEAFALKLLLGEPGDAIETRCPLLPLDAAWSDAVRRAPPLSAPARDWNAPFLVSPTSGTTGAPKYILATHLEYYFSTIAWLGYVPLPEVCNYLSVMPLYFSGGRRRCLTHLLRGDCVVLYPALLTAADYVKLVGRHRIDVGFVVPSILRQLLAFAAEDKLLLPRLSALFCGGAPLSADEKRAVARRITPNFYDSYNTAATGLISLLRPGDIAQKAHSVGQPHALAEIEIVDEADRRLAAGETGRLRFRGPSLGRGIAGPSGTEAAAEGFRDGWYYTGELASLDAEGYVCLAGRVAEVIFRGGAKIHPGEIEAVLREHDSVAEAAVLGRPSADNEQIVSAIVVAKYPVAASELIAHCRMRLTPYKVPSEIRLMDALPRNSSGKIDKAALARLADEPLLHAKA